MWQIVGWGLVFCRYLAGCVEALLRGALAQGQMVAFFRPLCGFRGGVLAPLVLEVATAWQPPAAKEG